jgi:hypothetical protein
MVIQTLKRSTPRYFSVMGMEIRTAAMLTAREAADVTPARKARRYRSRDRASVGDEVDDGRNAATTARIFPSNGGVRMNRGLKYAKGAG